MNTTQAENLRILIRHMETNVRVPLRMITVNHICGTPSCAMGHARTVGALKHQLIDGLKEDAINGFGLSRDDEGRSAWVRLFGGSLMVYKGKTFMGRDQYEYVWEPTPKQWAAEARVVLAEHGYSMEPTPTAPELFVRNLTKRNVLSRRERLTVFLRRFLPDAKPSYTEPKRRHRTPHHIR